MWPRTELRALLEIQHPIIQAPMTGLTTPALVAAVSNAGALGSLGCATLATEVIRTEVTEIRKLTGRPFNLNFFVHPEPSIEPGTARVVRERLATYFRELGLGVPPEPSNLLPRFDEQRIQLLLELRPPVVSFHFGLPPQEALERIKRAGARVLSSATTVAEARWLEAQGADAIIAQGAEAGGHRGTFTLGRGAGLVGTMALVPQVVDAVRIPVIAAGGIADGRGITASFALGASGVQMGTVFLGCPEAAVSPLHRQALRQAKDEDTALTRVFSGRPARALRNRLIEENEGLATLDFPIQFSLTLPLTQVKSEAAQKAFSPFWAGQVAPLMRELPAAELINLLVAESAARPRESGHQVTGAR